MAEGKGQKLVKSIKKYELSCCQSNDCISDSYYLFLLPNFCPLPSALCHILFCIFKLSPDINTSLNENPVSLIFTYRDELFLCP